METLIHIYFNLIEYQYLLLFVAVLVEGPLATIMAGFVVAQNLMNPFIGILVIVISDLVGDIFFYYLGKSGRQFGKRMFRKKSSHLSELEDYYHKNTAKAILFGKIAHGLGAFFLFAAGVARIPFKKFLFYNALGTILKTIALLLIGYFFGHSYLRITKYFDMFGLITLGIGIATLLVYLVFAKKLRKKEAPQNEQSRLKLR